MLVQLAGQEAAGTLLPTAGWVVLMRTVIPDVDGHILVRENEPFDAMMLVVSTRPFESAITEYNVFPRLVWVSVLSIVPFPLASSNIAPLTVRQLITDTADDTVAVQVLAPVIVTVYVPPAVVAALLIVKLAVEAV